MQTFQEYWIQLKDKYGTSIAPFQIIMEGGEFKGFVDAQNERQDI